MMEQRSQSETLHGTNENILEKKMFIDLNNFIKLQTAP